MAGRMAALAMAAALLLVPCPASAQRGPLGPKGKMGRGMPKADAMIDRLRSMSPEERRRVLDNMPPERRRMMEQRLRRIQQMTPEERRRAVESLENFQNLPPERRQRVRRLFGVFSQMPEERRALLREEVTSLAAMKPEERREHMDSEPFRERYSPLERRWLNELSDALFEEDKPEL